MLNNRNEDLIADRYDPNYVISLESFSIRMNIDFYK